MIEVYKARARLWAVVEDEDQDNSNVVVLRADLLTLLRSDSRKDEALDKIDRLIAAYKATVGQ